MKKILFLLFLVSILSCSSDNATDENNTTTPVLTTTNATTISETTAKSGGIITSDGGAAITARGVVWSTAANPTTALSTKTSDGAGTGAFISNITDLIPDTTYYIRAYATNSTSTSYGEELSFTTVEDFSPWYAEGTVFCNNVVTHVVDVINPITGKTWMDRNLGASQVATNHLDSFSFGDLFQWGRGADGHQCRNATVTTARSDSDQPDNSSFIYTPISPLDWRDPRNDNLWQGVTGVNNPCPTGYRLPTHAEMEEEYSSWSIDNMYGAFNSALKLPAAGYRALQNGQVRNDLPSGGYWTSTVDQDKSFRLSFRDVAVAINNTARASGSSVRCIKN